MTDMSTCQHLHRALRAGEPPSEELLAHAEGCEACAELLVNDAELANAMLSGEAEEAAASGDALSRMRSVLETESTGLNALRGWSTPRRVAVVGGVAAGLLTVVALFSLRGDIDVYPRLRLYATVATYAALVVALVRLGLWRFDRALPPRMAEWGLLAIAIIVPIAFVAFPQAHMAHPLSLAGVGDDLVPRAVGCFLYGSGVALVMGGVALRFARGPKTSRPVFLILAAGLLGVAALELHCALTAPIHLGLGHSTVAITAGVGALFLRAWRNRPANP